MIHAEGAGDAWRFFYQKGNLSWFDFEKPDRRCLERFSKSKWIGRILKWTDLRPSEKIKILEAGCGTGMYSAALALQGFRVDAFDSNEKAVAITRELFQKMKIREPQFQPSVIQGNLLKIEAASNHAVYLAGRALNRFVPLPISLRSKLSVQILAVGQK